MYPRSKVAITQLQEATAFGAALLAKAALAGGTPMDTADLFDIDINPVRCDPMPGMREYAAEFAHRVSEE
jgi:hypothetical protein